MPCGLLNNGHGILRLLCDGSALYIMHSLHHIFGNILSPELICRCAGLIRRIKKSIGAEVIGNIGVLLIIERQAVVQLVVGIFLKVGRIGEGGINNILNPRVLCDINGESAIK